MLMDTAIAQLGPSDSEGLAAQNLSTSQRSQVMLKIDSLVLSVNLMKAAQYLSDEHLSPQPLMFLEVEMLIPDVCCRVYSSSY